MQYIANKHCQDLFLRKTWKKKINEVNQRRWLEKSGQLLEIVDQTHLALTSGKPLKKRS